MRERQYPFNRGQCGLSSNATSTTSVARSLALCSVQSCLIMWGHWKYSWLLFVDAVKLFAVETPVCGLPQARCVSLRKSVELWSNGSLFAVIESRNQVTVLSIKIIAKGHNKYTGWSIYLCVTYSCIVIIRCTETFLITLYNAYRMCVVHVCSTHITVHSPTLIYTRISHTVRTLQ